MSSTRDIALLAAGAAMGSRQPVQNFPSEIHHHEHRAPTDESAKLLKEMEQAALDKLDASIRIEGNGFNGVLHIVFQEWDDSYRGRFVFDLNGKKMTVEHSEGRLADPRQLVESMLAGLKEKAAEKIASEVLADAFRPFAQSADFGRIFRRTPSRL